MMMPSAMVHTTSMNAKTAKLINKYAKTFGENPTEMKRLWNSQNDQERHATRVLFENEIEAKIFMTQAKIDKKENV